jgi:hypothetical protein
LFSIRTHSTVCSQFPFCIFLGKNSFLHRLEERKKKSPLLFLCTILMLGRATSTKNAPKRPLPPFQNLFVKGLKVIFLFVHLFLCLVQRIFQSLCRKPRNTITNCR